MARGPAKLSDEQRAILAIVKARRIDYDNGREELDAKIEAMRESFLFERRTALKSAVQSAAAAGVPAKNIKLVLNITDHRTYQRWLEGYTPTPIAKDDGTGAYFFSVHPAAGELPARAILSRFQGFSPDVTLSFRDDGFLVVDGDLPHEMRTDLYGIYGNMPTNDLHPDTDTVNPWNELVDEVANALGQPEWADANHLPTRLRFTDTGQPLHVERAFELAHTTEND